MDYWYFKYGDKTSQLTGHELSCIHLFVAPLTSDMSVEVHEESYARIHLGNIGVNMDFFVARICFKGGSKYNINILQVFFFKTCFSLNPEGKKLFLIIEMKNRFIGQCIIIKLF
jgi:hypothetical protein